MPRYGFVCECGHKTSRMRRMERRDAPVECQECGEPMLRNDFAVEFPKEETAEFNQRSAGRLCPETGGRYMLKDQACSAEACEWREETVDVWLTDEGDPVPPGDCPECGSATIYEVCGTFDRVSERYPYFDKGLGIWLRSPGHRRQVMKAKGLVCLEGEAYAEAQRIHDAANREDEKLKAWWNDDYVDKFENDNEKKRILAHLQRENPNIMSPRRIK